MNPGEIVTGRYPTKYNGGDCMIFQIWNRSSPGHFSYCKQYLEAIINDCVQVEGGDKGGWKRVNDWEASYATPSSSKISLIKALANFNSQSQSSDWQVLAEINMLRSQWA